MILILGELTCHQTKSNYDLLVTPFFQMKRKTAIGKIAKTGAVSPSARLSTLLG